MSYGALLKFLGIKLDELRPLSLPLCAHCCKYIFKRESETKCGNAACGNLRSRTKEGKFQYFDLGSTLDRFKNDPFIKQHLSYAYDKMAELYEGILENHLYTYKQTMLR